MFLVKIFSQPTWDLADHIDTALQADQCSERCVVIDAKGSSKVALLRSLLKEIKKPQTNNKKQNQRLSSCAVFLRRLERGK